MLALCVNVYSIMVAIAVQESKIDLLDSPEDVKRKIKKVCHELLDYQQDDDDNEDDDDDGDGCSLCRHSVNLGT